MPNCAAATLESKLGPPQTTRCCAACPEPAWNTPGQPPAAEPLGPPTLVAGRDDSPEAAGIFRIFGGSAQPAEPAQNPVQMPEAKEPKPTPRPASPRRRPAAAKPASQSAALDQ